MAYQKKYATEEERSRAKSEAGKKGAAKRIALGHSRGGRPKGSVKEGPRADSKPHKTMYVREEDYNVYQRCAFSNGQSLVEFMHTHAESLKIKNQHLFDGRPGVNI